MSRMSRMAMNIPNTMQMNANIRRRPLPAGAPGLAAAGPFASAAVAAMTCLLALRGPREPIAAVAAVYAHDDGQTRPQDALLQHLARHGDPDRNALHDLGEIPRGILRREQAEYGARRRRYALDRAGHDLAGISIHVDLDLLAQFE